MNILFKKMKNIKYAKISQIFVNFILPNIKNYDIISI